MLTVWLTGLPSSGKTTLALRLAERLRLAGQGAEVLDGDDMRRHVSAGLGFSKDDREENVRRVGSLADTLSRQGIVAICAVIAPYRSLREEVRTLHDGRYFEVYLSAPLEVCAMRDVKGLYASQRAGTLHGLTGVGDPYEPPECAELVLPTHQQSVEESDETLWRSVAARLEGRDGT